MRIEILKGYCNGFSNENNSVTLRINTESSLNKHLCVVVNEVDEIYEIMLDFVRKHKQIVFYHTFRLVHNNEQYLRWATKHKGARYET